MELYVIPIILALIAIVIVLCVMLVITAQEIGESEHRSSAELNESIDQLHNKNLKK